jgi:PiT family inorganic phosphate transporter
MAFSHGNNDTQKTMGLIIMALASYYQLPDVHVPFRVIFLCASAIGLGTAFGGWRIIKTRGMSLVHLRPIPGFTAEASAATVIEVASRIGLPLSTTHIISSTIMGVAASKRLSAVRWGVGDNILYLSGSSRFLPGLSAPGPSARSLSLSCSPCHLTHVSRRNKRRLIL